MGEKSSKWKRITRRTFKIILALIASMLLLVMLIYVPFIQRVVLKQVGSMLEGRNIDFSYESLRLKFPLTLEGGDINFSMNDGKTALQSDSLYLHVGLDKLFRGALTLDNLLLSDASFHFTNDTTIDMNVRLKTLSLHQVDLYLGSLSLKGDSVYLSKGQMSLDLLGGQKSENTDSIAPLQGKIALRVIHIDSVDYDMNMSNQMQLSSHLDLGAIRDGHVDLKRQQVDVKDIYISRGGADMHILSLGSDDNQEVVSTPIDSIPSDSTSAWEVRVDHLQFVDGYYRLNSQDSSSFPIDFYEINVEMDSIYNKTLTVSADLRAMSAKQLNGFTLKKMYGDFHLQDEKINIDSLHIETDNSKLLLNVYAPGAVNSIFNNSLLYTDLVGYIGLMDLKVFYPDLQKELEDKEVDLDFRLAIDRNEVRLHRFKLWMNQNFDLNGKGGFIDYMRPLRMNGDVTLQGHIYDNSLLNQLLPNTIQIPTNVAINSIFKANKGDASTQVNVSTSSGDLTLGAEFSARDTSYMLSFSADKFQIGDVLSESDMGALSMNLDFKGQKFKFPGIVGNLKGEVSQFEYKGYDYNNLILDLSSSGDQIKLMIKDSTQSLQMGGNILLDTIGQGGYRVRGDLSVPKIIFSDLGLLPLEAEFGVDIQLDALWSNEIKKIFVELDSMTVLAGSGKSTKYRPIIVNAFSGKDSIALNAKSGDLNLDVTSPLGLNALLENINTVSKRVRTQIENERFSIDSLVSVLPILKVDVDAGANNGINGILSNIGLGFNNLMIVGDIGNGKLDIDGTIQNLVYNNMFIDTLAFDVKRDIDTVDLKFDVKRRAAKGLVQHLRVDGEITNSDVGVHFLLDNSNKMVNLDMGVRARLENGGYIVHFTPTDFIVANRSWKVNKDNRVEWTKDKKLVANVRFMNDNRLLQFVTEQSDLKGFSALKVTARHIHLKELTEMFTFLPPIGGEFSTDMYLYENTEHRGLEGTVAIDSLSYNNFQLGDLAVTSGLNYRQSSEFRDLKFIVKLDDKERIAANGTIEMKDGEPLLNIGVNVTELPLRIVNAFISQDLLAITGDISGNVKLENTFEAPDLNGQLTINDGGVGLPMLGSTFRIDKNPIKIKQSKVEFDNYRFYASDQSYLNLKGDIVLRSFSDIVTNISCIGNRFEFINGVRKDSAMLYGKAYVDINGMIKGDISNLRVDGNVDMLNESNISYVLASSSDVSMTNKADGLVQFVEFADTLNFNSFLGKKISITSSNFRMKILIKINPEVQVAVELPGGDDNSVSLVGGGDLIFGISSEEGITLYGKYTVSKGDVRYAVPVVGTKEFNIQSGSYVEWLGNAADARLQLSASEEVKASVQMEGEASRLVLFESIIRIGGTMQKPEITFDLNTPDDQAIQTQLATFSPEERSKEAMNLLIYGTYSGPGAVKSSGVNANAALYNFVESELNQWSRKNLKGVNLSFGVDTYDQYSASGQGSTRTDYSYQFSKNFFDDRIMVRVGGSISTDSDPESSVEENLIDDVDVEYRVKKHGKLYLKVFRHTDYVSVLEGDVTETGVGVLWRKQFTTWRNFFRRSLEKKMREDAKRNKEQQEQQEQKDENSIEK